MPRLTATQAQSEARICVAPVHLKKRRLWQSAGARQQQNSRPLQKLKMRRLWRPPCAFHQQLPIHSAGGRQLQKSRPLQPTASDRSELVLGEHRELTVASSRLGALDNYLFPVRAGRER
jgi:hypothetical protein